MNVHAIALWIGIAGSAAGIYFPLHSEHKTDRQAEIQQRVADQKNEVERATQRQKTIDALYQRLGNDEADIAIMKSIIKSRMPKDKQDLLDAIQAAQKHAQEQPDMVMFDKRQPVAHTEALDCVKTGTCITAADTPSERNPQ